MKVKLGKKRLALAAAFCIILAAGLAAANQTTLWLQGYPYTQPIPSPGHGGNEIWIALSGTETDLQYALDNGLLGLPTCTDGQILKFDLASSSWQCTDQTTGGSCQILHAFNQSEVNTQNNYTINIPNYCIDSVCTLVFTSYYSGKNYDEGKAITYYQDGTTNIWAASGYALRAGTNGNGNQELIIDLGGYDIRLYDDRSSENTPTQWTIYDNHSSRAGELIACATGGSTNGSGSSGTNLPNCANDQLIQFNSSTRNWECAYNCSDGQILKYNNATSAWECADEGGGGSGFTTCTTKSSSTCTGSCIVTCDSGWTMVGGGCYNTTGYRDHGAWIDRPSGNGWECRRYYDAGVVTYVRCCQ